MGGDSYERSRQMKPVKVRVVVREPPQVPPRGQEDLRASGVCCCDIGDSVSRGRRLLPFAGSVGEAGSSLAEPPLVREGPPGDSATTHGCPEGIWTGTNSLF